MGRDESFVTNSRAKPQQTPLVENHALPPTGVCCGLARLNVTFGSGGMMTTARTDLPYPCSSQAKTWGESSRRGEVM